MTTKTRVLLGIGCLAAGVAIGLLIAPEKGNEMRKRVQHKAKDLANSVGHLFANAKGQLEQLKGKARSSRAAAEEKVNRLKESFS